MNQLLSELMILIVAGVVATRLDNALIRIFHCYHAWKLRAARERFEMSLDDRTVVEPPEKWHQWHAEEISKWH